MKTIFIDVETTGKADFKRPPEDDCQPRIVQLAAILCDGSGREISSLNLVINTGVDIPEEASAIHGITNVFARTYGVRMFFALQIFWALVRQADEIAAHNIEFDWFVIQGESRRFVTDEHRRELFCTMKAMTPICKLPGKYEDYKWPRLIEAYRHAFGKEFDGAHDALADVRACKKIYYWLKNRPPEIPPAIIKPVTVDRLVGELRKAVG